MKIHTPDIQSKLERLVKHTEMIIHHAGPVSNIKSEYNMIQDDWNSLEETLPKWKKIEFTNNDFENCAGMFTKFSTICKTNMQTIKAICEDTLAVMVEENKIGQNEEKSTLTESPKEVSHFDGWGKLGVVSAILVGLGAWYGQVRYDQGKEEIRRDYDEFRKNLEYAKDSIIQENSTLMDSLEQYKIEIDCLKKVICKQKKNCK